MLSINDMKDDAKVLDHLDEILFIDSSITLSEEEYLKKSIQEKLVYEGCLSNSLFVVNEDIKALEDQQMAYIFSQNYNDVRFLLNLSLVSAPVVIKNEDENIEENLKKQLEQQGEISSLIELTKKAVGSYRIKYVEYDEPTATPPAKGSFFIIEPPVTIDPATLDWTTLDEKETSNLLSNCLHYAAGVVQSLQVPPKMFPQEVTDFVTDLPRLTDLGFVHARNKTSVNSVSFTTVKDPFKALFEGIITSDGTY